MSFDLNVYYPKHAHKRDARAAACLRCQSRAISSSAIRLSGIITMLSLSCGHTFRSCRRIIAPCLCLLVALALLSAPLSAQKTQPDKQAAAERAEAEAERLMQQGTAEALRQAIAKYEEALPLYQAIGERQRQV